MTKRLSIIITSYNYDLYIGAAIDSALAVAWCNKEVIVVDDGSTDNSTTIIKSYGCRIISIEKENGGQNSAANVGFAHSSGDVIIFLDSDDLLFPSLAQTVMPWFEVGKVAKVQYSLKYVDSAGEPLMFGGKTDAPSFNDSNTPDWCRQSMVKTGFYATPPDSGNAWNRRCIELIFPLPTRTVALSNDWFGNYADAYMSMIAPYWGDVISIPKVPLGAYRIHSKNVSLSFRTVPDAIIVRCDFLGNTADAATKFLTNRLGIDKRIDLRRNESHMRDHLAYRKLLPDRYGRTIPIVVLFATYTSAVLRADMKPMMKAVSIMWAMAVTICPIRIATRLIERRFEPDTRSMLLKKVGLLLGKRNVRA